jgi:hypothetical protein
MSPLFTTPLQFTPPLLAFGFGTGWMLWFLTAAAAPIIIHLWNKRRHREMRWAAMQYLLAAIRNNSRRITIEQLILLLVRTLIVLLLAIAVAEPFLDAAEGLGGLFWPIMIGLVVVPVLLWLALFSRGHWWLRSAVAIGILVVTAGGFAMFDWKAIDPFRASAAAGKRTHRVIVLDGSYSMDYKPGDESRFQRAQAIVRQIVEASPLGDGFTLVLMAEPPRVLVGTPVFDKADFLDEISKLRLPHAGADLAATLAKVQDVLQVARRDQPKLARHEVHLISDLGKNTWRLASPEAQSALRRQASKLTELAGLIVYDVGQPDAHNIAMTAAQLTRFRAPVKFATVRRDTTIKFDVRNFGSQEAAQQVVELWVDGRRSDKTTLDVPSHGQASGSFTYRFETPGEHGVEVRLAGDPLQVDNSRFLSVPVRPQLKVLCIDGRPASDVFASSTGYLVQALRDDRDPNEGQIQAEVDTERALRDRNLEPFDAVFVCNVAQFNQEEAVALHKYVSRGGGLVFFLGERVQAENYNLWLGGGSAVPRVLPARLDPNVGVVSRDQLKLESEATFLTPFEHEIVRLFEGRPDVKFAGSPINKWFKLRLVEDKKEGVPESRAQVALKFVNGDPAIVEERIGRGRSILVATSADQGPLPDATSPAHEYWSYMPRLHNYLPFVRELLSAAVVGQFEKRNLTVGDALSGSTGLLGSNASVTIRTPWNSTEQAPVRSLDDHGQWQWSETEQRGVYTARVPGTETRDIAFAVNVNTRESDLAKLSETDLSEDAWAGVKHTYLTSWQGLDDRPTVVGVQRQFVDTWLLAAVCALVLAETFLAWLFGRSGN